MTVTNTTRRAAALAAQIRIDGQAVTHRASDGTETSLTACLAEVDPQVMAVIAGGEDIERAIDAVFSDASLPAGSPVEGERVTIDDDVYVLQRPGKLSGPYWTARLVRRAVRHRSGPNVYQT
jgi:hypothetical protein